MEVLGTQVLSLSANYFSNNRFDKRLAYIQCQRCHRPWREHRYLSCVELPGEFMPPGG